MKYRFYVSGRVIPAVRMTRKGKFVSRRAQEYLARKDEIAYSIKYQMVQNGWQELPDKTPLAITIVFFMTYSLHKSDWDNLAKAVQDAMQGIVFKNDLWVDRAIIEKRLIPGGSDHTTIIVETITE